MKRILMSLAILSSILPIAAGCRQAGDCNFMELAKDRYSVRSFDSKKVDRAVVDRILEAGRLAPTAVNSQPQKIYVVESVEKMELLNQISPCMYGAPHCFVVCYDKQLAVPRGERDYGEIDATIVLTHMTMQATAEGIGTCIVGYFDPEKLKTALELPENLCPVLLLPFGYPSEGSKPSDKHFASRDLEDMVNYL